MVSKGYDIERRSAVFGGELTRIARGDGHQESRSVWQRIRKGVHRRNNDRLLETRFQQVDPMERQRR